MKKIIVAAASLFMSASLFAYNPPAGGQNSLRITSPELLTGAKSAAGGPLLHVTPDSILNNPALPGFNQRSTLTAGGTLLFDSADDDHSLGGGFELGILLANRWCVPTAIIQGVFVPYEHMQLGSSMNLTLGYAKDITDSVSVGISGNVGLLWGFESDWTASAGLGAYWDYGDIKFLKNVRFGSAITNLGKMYTKTTVNGIKTKDITLPNGTSAEVYDEASMWPGIATLRIGSAATLVDAENFKLGVSADFAFPGFQDFVFDAGLQMQFFKIVKLSSSWEFDVQEFANDAKNILPSVGLSFNFIFKSNNEKLSSKGWEQSEVTTSAAWQRMYKNVDAVSAGIEVDLGLKDTQAPEITMWGDN